jgi:3-deoxy-D-manno-octulosonic acid kinase
MAASSGTRPMSHRAVRGHAGTALAHPSVAGEVERVLERGTLHDFAAGHPERRPLGGRGEAWRIPAPAPTVDASGFWVVRHFERGGSVMRPLLGDRYLRLGPPRSFAELRASEAARARGVRTPRALAAAVYPAGPFRRADLITEWLPDSVDLWTVLYGAPSELDPAGRRTMLGKAGALVRELALAGVEHADLNATNVLVRGGAAGDLWVIDLDRARLHPEAVASAGVHMLARLERSLAKLARSAGGAFGDDERAALRGGAGDLNDLIGRDVPAAAS